MARGQQKIQSQQKNAAKQAKLKKGGTDQKAAAKKALIYTAQSASLRCPTQRLINNTLRASIQNSLYLKS